MLKNSLSEQIQLKLNNTVNYSNVQITIFNISGQQLLKKNLENPTGEISISHQLKRGIYILNILDTETTYSIKIVVQ